MKILIFGMGNIGKSTVGELLARKIGYDFIDMDTKIKEKYGTMLGFKMNIMINMNVMNCEQK